MKSNLSITQKFQAPSNILRPSLVRKKSVIGVATQEGIHIVKLANIYYCKADGNYSEIHLTNGTKITMSKCLKVLEPLLPEHLFLRVHQSYIINMECVSKIDKEITMNKGELIPISRRRRPDLKEQFSRFVAFV